MSDAAGTDGMHVKDARRLPLQHLSLLFNCMLFAGVTPPSLSKCRLTLIPKGDNNHQYDNNWRPITVGSMLVQIFHKIFARRLSALLLYSTRPLYIITLDLRKAFDTVPHQAIERAVGRLGVDQSFTKYAMFTLSECTTTISCGQYQTAHIRILRLIKQGGPITPLFFDAVLDELIRKMSN